VDAATEAPQFGVLGQPRVNVLLLNLALDARHGERAHNSPHECASQRRPHAQADALLGELQRQGGGRLTIFLGAAPGVGKTYAMLSRARELKKRGVDVVVGLVETHGRARPQALLDGLDVLPRRASSTAAARSRNWTSTPCSRASRRSRWWTNWRIATSPAAATSAAGRTWWNCWMPASTSTPRSTSSTWKASTTWSTGSPACASARPCRMLVFDRLRDIVLVDLPPRELIERLQQGKVYVPEQAAQALQSFFSPSNLTALRELAMQTAADRVDSDLREAQTARGLPGSSLRRACWWRSMAAASPSTWCGWRGAWPSAAMRRGRVVSVQSGAQARRRRATRARPRVRAGAPARAATPNCCTGRASSMRCSTMPAAAASRRSCSGAPASVRSRACSTAP
jgi:hypothetical protein